MFNREKNIASFPPEVVTSLDDLMRYQWLVQNRRLLPDHPVYSILAGRHSSRLRGRGLDFEEVRQYVPGDDIRNIDWRVTARTGKTHSKVFNEEKERPGFVLLDQSSRMFFGSQRFVKSVTAAHAAALGAFYVVKRGDRAGGIVFNEDGYDYVPPRRNKESLQYLLQCMVKRNETLPGRKAIQFDVQLLNNYLRMVQTTVTHDYVITVISDFSNIDDETRRILKNLSYHNDVILIHIYDALDQALPDGRLVITDGIHQLHWNNRRRNRGPKYQKDFVDFKIKLKDDFRHTRIPVVFFNTNEPVESQVMHDMETLDTR